MTRRALCLTLLTLLVFAGCGVRGSGGELRQMDRVPLVVENQNFYQATIFAVVSSSRVRLGEVPGNATVTLHAPAPPAGRISVEVRLLAVGAFESYPISFAPGDTVLVTVPPDLHRRRPIRRR